MHGATTVSNVDEMDLLRVCMDHTSTLMPRHVKSSTIDAQVIWQIFPKIDSRLERRPEPLFTMDIEVI
jgi:hypothetical protein